MTVSDSYVRMLSKDTLVIRVDRNNFRLIDFGHASELAEGDRTGLVTESIAQGFHGYLLSL